MKTEIEVYTFNEFIEAANNDPEANIVDGRPWSFSLNGCNVTHENDDRYIITTFDAIIDFTPNDVLFFPSIGKAVVLEKTIID